MLTHALLDAAIIKLHKTFSDGNPASREYCLMAARNIIEVGGVRVEEFRCLNPMMGVRFSLFRASWFWLMSTGVVGV